MSVAQASLCGLLVLALVTAGCVTGEGQSEQTPPSVSASPSFDESTGAIHGVVTTEEGVPLIGASVGLVELPEKTTTTTDTGEFAINNVPPGTYTISANALGYESAAGKIEVVLGQVTEKTFTLVALESEVGYPTTQIKDGVLACSFRAYPGVPLAGIVAAGWYTGVAVCGLPTVNTTTGDKFLLNWDSPKGVQAVTLEMRWQTNQALGKGLTVNLEDPSGINNGRPIYGSDTGPSPLRVDADENRTLNVTTATSRDCLEGQCRFTTRVFAEANTTEFYLPADPPPVGPFGKPRNKVDVGLVTNQRFTQYLTTFHNMGMPEGFTAMADQ